MISPNLYAKCPSPSSFIGATFWKKHWKIHWLSCRKIIVQKRDAYQIHTGANWATQVCHRCHEVNKWKGVVMSNISTGMAAGGGAGCPPKFEVPAPKVDVPPAPGAAGGFHDKFFELQSCCKGAGPKLALIWFEFHQSEFCPRPIPPCWALAIIEAAVSITLLLRPLLGGAPCMLSVFCCLLRDLVGREAWSRYPPA